MDPLSAGGGLASSLMSVGGLVAILASFVAFDMAGHAHLNQGAPRLRWLSGAGLALATGFCSVLALAVREQPLPYELSYERLIALGVWCGAAVLSALSIGCTDARLHPFKLAVAAFGLTVVAMLAPFGLLWSIAPSPGFEWSAGHLTLALIYHAVGVTSALSVVALKLPERYKRATPALQFVATLLLAAAVVAGQHQVIEAADLASQQQAGPGRTLSSDGLGTLASFGSIALLLAMLVLSRVEAQRRQTAQAAVARTPVNPLRDRLTGLPTRQVFEGTIAQAVRQADTAHGSFSLLFIDLDGFKSINQAYGEGAGDQLLRELSRRLRGLAQPHMLARMVDDGFVMLLSGNPDNAAAAQLASDVLGRLGEPCDVGGHEMAVTCSIGIAMYPAHGALATLIRHAEAAMRSSKSSGGATYSFFDPRMLESQRETAELLRDLRLALANKQFELYYQPKIHAPSGEITGAEALIRWHHPQRGMISPAIFIPIAERYGLIESLGNWVLETACAQVHTWREEGLRMRVAINLSVHQLRDPALPERIAAVLKRNEINPQLLTCEITESVAMEDAERTIKLFERLAAVGVHIAIDDFGTGYSSLSYLRKLPAHELKIDRSFVLDLESSSDARAVVDAVVKLAQALSLKVVAEGVETEEQNEILRSLGCNELQGFLFAKPMSAKALALWAMSDEGPRSLVFRESLFKETMPAPA